MISAPLHFSYEGIAVHPSHDLTFLPSSSSTEDSDPFSSEVFYSDSDSDPEEEELVDSLPHIEELMLDPSTPHGWNRSSGSSSGSSTNTDLEGGHDYFSYPSPRRSSNTRMDDLEDHSPPSSTSSTPTRETPFGKMALANSPSLNSSSSTFPPSPSVASQFAAFSFTPSLPVPPSLHSHRRVSFTDPPLSENSPPSPSRRHPYSRLTRSPTQPSPPQIRSPAPAPMLRSYSTPVETQFQMDARMKQRSAMVESMTQLAPEIVRSRSSGVYLPSSRPGTLSSADAAKGTSTPMSRSKTPPQVQLAFGEGWGSKLPSPSPPQPVEPSTYPYNIHIIPSPPRVPRSFSTTAIPSPILERKESPEAERVGVVKDEGLLMPPSTTVGRGRVSRGLSF